MALVDGGLPFLLFIVVTAATHFWWASESDDGASSLHRSSFPDGFIFGTASSAYQYEGAAREGGRGPSIWDTFTHRHPEKIVDGSSGDVAVDSYHHYKDDVKIMKEMGMDAYRFSISWSRILPNGSLSGGVNKEGIQYYNNLINELISNGLQPFITLFHWDSPQGLEDKYGGFLSEHIVKTPYYLTKAISEEERGLSWRGPLSILWADTEVDPPAVFSLVLRSDFRDYADVCFKEFGDRVKHWITLNEPLTVCNNGYTKGTFAPGRCSPWEGRCSAGDSSREPYIVAHHLLLSHATAVELYRQKYQEEQEGEIGITLDCKWAFPYSGSGSNVIAAKRSVDFQFGWFMDPMTRGDYPYSMRELVGDRLPKFSQEQSKLVKGSFDFIGLNYYTSFYAYSVPPATNANASYTTDSRAKTTHIRNGVPIGPMAASDWLYIYPPGLRELLRFMKNKYNNPVVYITENGVDEWNNKTASLEDALNDQTRVDYYREHLLYVQRAIREGVKVKGYFAWSLLDNFEWKDGYTVRFGINFVNYQDGLKRYPKKSALWFHKFLE